MVTAGLCRKRPCMISPSVRLMHASAAQRMTSASKRAQSAKARLKRKSPATSVSATRKVLTAEGRPRRVVEPRLEPDETLLDGGREGRSGGGRGAVGEGLHGGGEATQRERTSNVKDGCRRGRAAAP